MAARFPIELGALVIDCQVVAEVHSTDGVDDVGNPAHADLCVVIDRQSRELFNGLNEESGTAVGIGCVEFVPPVSGDFNVGVSGE